MEDGRAELDDMLSDRIADLKRARERAHAALERARSAAPATGEANSPVAIERFTRAMRERLRGGTIQYRRAYLGTLIGRIEVDDRQVRIFGQKQALEQAILATRQGADGVLRSVPKWRPRQICKERGMPMA
jgi:hypothetical protein